MKSFRTSRQTCKRMSSSNKGGMFFSSDETQVHIIKHVLKTLCSDVTNILVNFLAADLMMSVENPSTITSEVCPPLFGGPRTKGLLPTPIV